MSDKTSTSIDYDESEHARDVFAYFGRAFYEAGVVETGLALTIMHLDFLTKEAERLKRDGLANFDRSSYEVAFDAFMEKQHRSTLGNLIKNLKSISDLPNNIAKLLDDTKVERDFLAHHFFRDRAIEFMTRKGRITMIAELEEAHALFLETDRVVTDWAKPFRERIGLREESFERYYADFITSLPKDD